MQIAQEINVPQQMDETPHSQKAIWIHKEDQVSLQAPNLNIRELKKKQTYKSIKLIKGF